MTFWQKQGDPAGRMKEEMIRSAHRPDRNDLKIVPKRRIYVTIHSRIAHLLRDYGPQLMA